MKFESPKDSVKTHRSHKALAREEGIVVSGNVGNDIEKVYGGVEATYEELLLEYSPWIEEKCQSLQPYLGEYTQDEVREFYEHGLHNLVKQEVRLYKKTGLDDLASLQDRETQEDLIFAYTFDFIRNIRSLGKEGFSPNRTVDYARKSFRFKPQDYRIAQEENPSTPDYVVLNALTEQAHPEKYLQKFEELSTELSLEFPDFRSSSITEALVRSRNPRRYLAEITEEIERQQEIYPEISRSVIEYAVFQRPTNPESILDRFAEMETLAKEYPEFEPWIISKSLYSPDPATYLTQLKAKVEVLSETFPQLGFGVITYAATSNANPKKLLEDFLEEVPKLEKEFPEIPSAEINDVALKRANPKILLSKAMDQVNELKPQYPGLDNWVIPYLAIRKLDKTKETLDLILEKVPILKEKYPNLNENLLLRACVFNRDPDKWLDTLSVKVTSLRTSYPYLKDWVLMLAATTFTDPLARLNSYMPTFESERVQHPEQDPSNLMGDIIKSPKRFGIEESGLGQIGQE